jgi:glycosyltransferase involved in cell wall biosynthesis
MILFAGRLTREKGAEVLIRAFAVAAHQYPEARLEIAGDGPERGNLSALAARLGIASSVRFPGKLSNREVTRRMREAWAVCIPSVWEEPFGFVAAEAQLHGIAVIASDMGGLREILDEGRAGVSVAPGSVEELTGAITRIFSSRHLAGEIGHSGRLRALREFSSERFGDEFEKVFFELARPRKT